MAKFKYLTYDDRLNIEKMYKSGMSTPKIANALGEDGDLDLGGAGVVVGLTEFLDEFGGLLLGDAELCCHFFHLSSI